jgi:adenylate kinase family enzyme
MDEEGRPHTGGGSGFPRRLVVVGASGSGKTTLARDVARRLDLPHVELDALHWGPNWTESPLPIFRERVERALGGERWVADGNYSRVRDVTWNRADTLVWLDYSLVLVMYRLITRTLGRALSREELWNDNREPLWEPFFSRKSLWLWALQQHPRHRRQYPELLSRAEFQHLDIVRLRTPRAPRSWLTGLEAPAVAPR